MTLLNSKNELIVSNIKGDDLPKDLEDGKILKITGQVNLTTEIQLTSTNHFVHPNYFDLKKFEDMVKLLEKIKTRAKL